MSENAQLCANEPQKKYLGVKDIPNEGTFHVYEGGHRIPTHVDGEQVNPQWGLTKANKPRKRLALACLDCREKKIKCEPGINSCLQCEKAKRTCRNEPNGEHNITKRRSREDPSPPNVPSKKHRSASPSLEPEPASAGVAKVADVAALGPTVFVPDKVLAWEEDPFAVDREVSRHLIDSYFNHVNSGAYCLFPRKRFMDWLTHATDKCQRERTMLYAMLAMGSVFTDDRFSGYGKRCAQVAKDAILATISTSDLPVIQARLVMALYYTGKGASGLARDFAGLAIRACSGSGQSLFTEPAPDAMERLRARGRIEFWLTPEQLVECGRRTFWSCFLLDRYECGTLCAIDLRDIFLRLPCADDCYERGSVSDAPYYNNGIVEPLRTILTPSSAVCPMAWLCLLSAIWGDVLTFSSRMIHRSNDSFREAYEAFYAETQNRLQGWSSRLPEYLHYSEENIRRSMLGGYGIVFVSTHTLYHCILMRLNRYVRYKVVAPETVKRNIRDAHHHAHKLLTMLGAEKAAFAELSSSIPAPAERCDPLLSTPFAGYAAILAIDIVGAGGLETGLRATLDATNNALDCFQTISRCWNSARNQLIDAQTRHLQIRNVLQRPNKTRSGAWLGSQWGIKDPLVEFERHHDCIYPYDEHSREDGYSPMYFDALREGGHRSSPSGSVRVA
ncbi:hypothetical protein BAUCODRAFT_74686 [Baudoinia panamericana UAMH 10762]|uniref:Zn(2)-C6 fungal-type domain-containing protein n=1 Tax=Baudoinia panamericana (strain UAMH 10762) TaxID=717646 RepID=M2LIU7_BAUPA|nr:uncharacterized protein BAUCODRAFT_74686 [Baudoinia panamericana UAMH 10762]EMC94122.1 hypothetical protein BAUCODRAFT_74686 [Baudoinia panamericana UAMH 10762]